MNLQLNGVPIFGTKVTYAPENFIIS